MSAEFSMSDAKRAASELRVDTNVVSLSRLLVGMNVEREHLLRYQRMGLNVANRDDPIVAAKIALAHFVENPGTTNFGDYYVWLDDMERRADVFYKTRLLRQREARPNPILPKPRAQPDVSFFELYPSVNIATSGHQ